MLCDWLSLAIVLLLVASSTHASCPSKCRCVGAHTVVCNGLTPNTVPLTDIPKDTTVLDLSKNGLETLDLQELKHLTKLNTLVLSRNKFKDLPRDISLFLPSLKNIYLNSNIMLESLSRISLEMAFNLERIVVSDSNIAELQSDMFFNNSRLLHLDISDNKIKRVHRNAFYGLKSLKYLKLQHNVLSDIDAETFLALKSLRNISIAFNNIERITGNLFKESKSVEHIDFSNNRVKNLSSDAFQNIRNVSEILLKHNRIKKFPKTAFQSTFVWNFVDMEENPLECECFIVALEMMTLQLSGKLKAKCASPVGVKGRWVKTLTRKELGCTTCDFNECKNNGTCVIKEDYYQCNCHKGFQGKFCEKTIEEDNTDLIWIIVLSVLIVLAIVAIVIGVWYYRKKKGKQFCIMTKTQCCCCCFLFLVFGVMILFFTLRIVSYMYEHS